MKRFTTQIMLVITLASFIPSAAHAGGSDKEATAQAALVKAREDLAKRKAELDKGEKPVTIVAKDVGASPDIDFLNSLEIKDWFGGHWFSKLSREVNKRFAQMVAPNACGKAFIKGNVRKAAHTVFSSVPILSKIDHAKMEALDPKAMAAASEPYKDGENYSKARFEGGIVSVTKGLVMRGNARQAFNVAQITGDAAMIQELKDPSCMKPYLAWQRARVVALKKRAEMIQAKADTYNKDEAQYDKRMSAKNKLLERSLASSQKATAYEQDPDRVLAAHLQSDRDRMTGAAFLK
jgi:hypothetical protein